VTAHARGCVLGGLVPTLSDPGGNVSPSERECETEIQGQRADEADEQRVDQVGGDADLVDGDDHGKRDNRSLGNPTQERGLVKPISPAPTSMAPRTNRASNGATSKMTAATISFGIYSTIWLSSSLTWVIPSTLAAATRKTIRMSHLTGSPATRLGLNRSLRAHRRRG
jgi:hypothetical protein